LADGNLNKTKTSVLSFRRLVQDMVHGVSGRPAAPHAAKAKRSAPGPVCMDQLVRLAAQNLTGKLNHATHRFVNVPTSAGASEYKLSENSLWRYTFKWSETQYFGLYDLLEEQHIRSLDILL